MSKTRHIHQRLNQRAITESMLELTRAFGVDQGDKIILNKKGIDKLIIEMNKCKSSLMRMRNKGGLVLVEDRGVEITAYSLGSYVRH